MSTTINQSDINAYNVIGNANQFKVNNGGICVLPNRWNGTTLNNMLSVDGAICWNSGRGTVQFLGNYNELNIKIYKTP